MGRPSKPIEDKAVEVHVYVPPSKLALVGGKKNAQKIAHYFIKLLAVGNVIEVNGDMATITAWTTTTVSYAIGAVNITDFIPEFLAKFRA
jgi:hypothetical protein